MLKRSLLALCALAATAMVGAGCGSQQGATTLSFVRGKDTPSIITADRTGTYALYPNDSYNPKRRLDLSRGDQYGFARRGDRIVGVARDEEISLGETLATAYYWKYQGRK